MGFAISPEDFQSIDYSKQTDINDTAKFSWKKYKFEVSNQDTKIASKMYLETIFTPFHSEKVKKKFV